MEGLESLEEPFLLQNPGRTQTPYGNEPELTAEDVSPERVKNDFEVRRSESRYDELTTSHDLAPLVAVLGVQEEDREQQRHR